MEQSKTKKKKKIKNVYDLSLRNALSGIEGDLTIAFLGFEIKSVEDMENDFIKIEEKKADYVCKITDKENKKYVLHIEFQSTNNFYMNFRMLRYLTELNKKEKLPVIQLVVYVGKDKMNMKNEIKFEAYKTSIDYKYQLVDMSTLSCEKFLNSKN